MKQVLLAVIFFSSITGINGQSPISGTLLKKLDSISTQDVPNQAPGIVTAIVRNGQVVYQRYAGYANLEDSTLIQASTRFNIASNGKQFTALALLRLIDQKKLSLQDDIRKWFPDFYPDVQEPITIGNLLNHTSGIRDCYDLLSLNGLTWWQQAFGNAEILELLSKQTQLNFSPGSKHLYSNSNYILLAVIIEKVTGQSFNGYTQEMFELLGMPNTSFVDNASEIRGPIARPYFNFGSWSTYEWIWNACGDGNLFTTLNDQIQWEKLVQGKAKSQIKQSLIRQSQQLLEGSPVTNYGYGLEFGTYKGMRYLFHEGATGAWKATFLRFPEKNASMLTFTNSGKSIPSMQTRQLADAYFGLKQDCEFLITKPTTIGNYVSERDLVGTYLTDDDFAFTFELKEGKLFLKRAGRNDVELEREADNILRQKYDPDFKQEFLTNEKGELQVTVYYVTHAPYTLTRTPAIESNFDWSQYNGEYINHETGTTLSISHTNSQNFEVIINDRKFAGLLISESKMVVDFYSLSLSEGSLLLNGNRIKKVAFVKRTR